MCSGIYKIVNKKNGHIYVGGTKHLHKRWYEHSKALKGGGHINRHLQGAWNLYGEECFEFEILEECLLENLTEREQYWLDKLNPEYNILKVARSPLGYRHTDEAKKKVSLAQMGNKANLGRHPSEETKKKLSLSKIGNKHGLGNKSRTGYKNSPEHIERVRQANLGHKYSLGRKHSQSAKKKMSESRLGKPLPKGRKASPETRAKLSLARMGNKNRLGIPHTEESKAKIWETRRRNQKTKLNMEIKEDE